MASVAFLKNVDGSRLAGSHTGGQAVMEHAVREDQLVSKAGRTSADAVPDLDVSLSVWDRSGLGLR